ncbi:SapC family protein [Sphingomonadaceae bacterium OTU29MARTA1]|uniref:SapC family protein n=1 Tax=Sphingomonas sp. Leaf37 TaxID=2876552 RepID=UPI001E4F18B5|nr:SapC family protein [Sphingomonas sp. Leaf37]USU06726.1 SapC family protein [Sphingomonadaceae bacterium OTU29LAMAA1]USU10095.1 SapC family protein [Sphingomonadaceae bacterium OTU29MARTA1]USU13545.1 SapC family protein [Sphingomonadaceae bacterium OTU29THOMA1]
MASAPLPLFYNGLEPLSSETHATWRVRQQDSAPFLVGQHAVPITTDEFPMVQRHMPIVFSVGEDAIPLALMGLNEGVNVFMGDDGKLTETNFYVPAYVRRYPYMLARLRPDSDELSLCFDPTSEALGAFDEGDVLFENGQPSQTTKAILDFAEQFEQAGARTQAFMNELREQELLMEGEVTIQADQNQQPFVYRGFQMINEEKLAGLRGDQLRKMSQSGMLPLLYAHLFSLSLMREIFARQVTLGKTPQPQIG